MVRTLMMESELPPQSVVDAAIDWAVKLRLGSPSPETRAAFDAWLSSDALHAQAWERVQTMFGAMSEMRGTVAADVLRTLHDERARQRGRRRAALRKLAVMGVISPLAFWLSREYTPWQRLVADSSTRLGERRQLQLADGSWVDLNSDTAISFDQTADRRMLTLHRGEIYVRTGHDAGLSADAPFFVRTPQGLIQALGTRFIVRLEPETSRLFVDEGAVRLLPADGRTLVLSAGQGGWLTSTEAGHSPAPSIDPMSWKDGIISSNGARLADLLSEIARYRAGRIVCHPSIADRRISGTFFVDDTDAVLRLLARTQSLTLTYYTPLWVHVDPKSSSAAQGDTQVTNLTN